MPAAYFGAGSSGGGGSMPVPWLGLGLGALSLLGSLFGGKKKPKYVPPGEAYFDPYQLFGFSPEQRADLLNRAFSGISTTTGTTDEIANSLVEALQTIDTSTMPVITPEFSPLVGAVRQAAEGRLRQASALPLGYEQTQLAGLSQAQEAGQRALENRLAEAGILGSPLQASGENALEAARFGQIANLRGQLPLLERQLRNEDIAQASGLAQAFGRGTRTTGTTRTTTRGTRTTRGTQNLRQTAPPPLLAPVPNVPYPQQPSQTQNLLNQLLMLYGMGAFGNFR